jgi:pseudouridine 5'-phosphatase
MTPPPSGLKPVRACLFDMDGLLLDTEDLYSECTNLVLREHGKPELPWSIKANLQGRPGPEAYALFQQWAQLPLSGDEFFAAARKHQERLFPTAQPLPGTLDLLRRIRKSEPQVAIALATSSTSLNFDLKTSHLPDMFDNFDQRHIITGDDKRVAPGRGKPAPDIYLLALETINEVARSNGEKEISPDECLVFEDSVPGVEAGRRAGMQVVWCPHPGLLEECRGREKKVLAGLTNELDHDRKSGFAANESSNVAAAPGAIDDGWAHLFTTLESFPLAYYGIGRVTTN